MTFINYLRLKTITKRIEVIGLELITLEVLSVCLFLASTVVLKAEGCGFDSGHGPLCVHQTL